MKKILTVSLVAMMAVSAARADIASVAYVNRVSGQAQAGAEATAAEALASAKGELNNAIALKADKTALDGLSTTVSGIDAAYKAADVALGQRIDGLTGTGDQAAVTNETFDAFKEANTAAISKAQSDAIAAAKTETETQIAGLDSNAAATDGSVLTGVTITDGKITAKTEKALGTLATKSTIVGADITDGTIAAADLGTDSVVTAKIADGNVTEAKLATELATKINGAQTIANMTNTAVQGEAAKTSYPTVELMNKSIGDAITDNVIDGFVGATTGLQTTDKSTIVGAINEVNANADKAQADATQALADAANAQATADKAVKANTAITAGTATKITYDAKGLVTKGEALTKADIPTIDQSQVSGLETALAGKQSTSTAAYQVGGANGTWTALNANLPTACQGTGVTCSLISKDGNISWEVITY